jgi:hypothetical protein
MMRSAALVVAAVLTLLCLPEVQHEILFWLGDGSYRPIRLSAVWIALLGTPSDPLWFSDGSSLVGWLLNRPLSVVFLPAAAFLVWIGMDGFGRATSRSW